MASAFATVVGRLAFESFLHHWLTFAIIRVILEEPRFSPQEAGLRLIQCITFLFTGNYIRPRPYRLSGRRNLLLWMSFHDDAAILG